MTFYMAGVVNDMEWLKTNENHKARSDKQWLSKEVFLLWRKTE